MNQFDFIRDAMSIDYIVNPDMAITLEIYKYLVEKYTLSNGIFTTGKASLLETKASKIPKLINTKIHETSAILPNMLIVAISRYGKIIIPHGDSEILPEDELYIIGERKPIMKLNSKVHEKENILIFKK